MSLSHLFRKSFLPVSIVSLLALFSVYGRAATIFVPANGDFQAALNSSQFGDTIVLQAGATYQSPTGFILPNKGPGTGTDADYITIQTSNLSGIPAANVRLNPAIQGSALARLMGTSIYPAINTAIGAHHYKLIGLEMTTNGSAYTTDLVDLGADTNRIQRLTMKGFVIDRCFIHPAEISAGNLFPSTLSRTAGRGIGASVTDLWVLNSYIAGFAGRFPPGSSEAGAMIDSYGVYSPVGPGPMHITNNYIEAQFNNVFTGGADPDTPNTATVSNPTTTSATLSNVNNLSVGNLIALASTSSTPKPWEVGSVTGISGNDISYTILRPSNGSGAVAPDNGGQARWNGDHIHDVTIQGNTLNKPDVWNSFSYPKAWIELKECVNCLIDGNDMYSGIGTTIALTVRNQNGGAPWATLSNVTFSNNRMSGYKWAIGAQLSDDEEISTVGDHLTVTNNLFINPLNVSGVPQLVNQGAGDFITYTHNTILNPGAVW